jgi:hypothetical protein
MPWYKISLSGDDIALGKGIRLQEAFGALHFAHGSPKDAALFASGIEPRIYYFPPGAIEIAQPILSGYEVIECKPKFRRGQSDCGGWLR